MFKSGYRNGKEKRGNPIMNKSRIIILSTLVLCNLVFADIQIKGSETMTYLVHQLAHGYMLGHDGTTVSVWGGGTSTGISALMEGKTDIANSARVLNNVETASMKEANKEPRSVVIAAYGLAMVVNASNPLTKISMEDIRKIYNGEITNWKELGGSDKPITVFGRQKSSGTFHFFQEYVLAGNSYLDKMKKLKGHTEIVEAVKHRDNGIGYVGIEYAKNDSKLLNGVKILNISLSADSVAYNPLDDDTIFSGNYPLAQGLRQYVVGTPKGEVRDFLKWELSPEGQKAVEAEGFYPAKGTFAVDNDKAFVQ